MLAKLDAMGLANETVVVFTSDHGEFLGNHGLLHKGPPPHCDLCRVSFVMAGPGVPEGQRTSAPSSHLDLMPTLLELAGVGAPPDGDGWSLVPVLQGDVPAPRDRFLEFHPRIDGRAYNHSVVTDGWRLTLYPDGEPDWGELFNLEADPGEHRNLFSDPAHRARRDRLADRLASRFPAMPNAGTALIAKW